jgi:sugar transferase (PEP-CTERM/EpsH1 system associated)
MEAVLYLVHRIPFPPEKGDKLRSFHLLRFLSSRYRVHLGTFVDDPADMQHVENVARYCHRYRVAMLRPHRARLRSLSGLLTREALTLRYYRDPVLGNWIRRTVRENGIRRAVVFSSSMAQYVASLPGMRPIVDFVDVDSAKWREFGQARRWPMSTLFSLEGERLSRYERFIANQAHASVFVTPAEAELFRQLAPECAARTMCIQNGVDVDYFSPDRARPSPYAVDEEAIVFTGAMDYWPNVEGVCWFARNVLPSIVASRPRARFYVVGMKPASAVQALARDGRISVTGRVDDVRPYLQHAKVVVAPLQIARGIQNKVLEAMSMARPVVASAAAATGINAVPGVDFEIAEDAAEFARKTISIIDGSCAEDLGAAARARVDVNYAWSQNLSPFFDLLESEAIDEHLRNEPDRVASSRASPLLPHDARTEFAARADHPIRA